MIPNPNPNRTRTRTPNPTSTPPPTRPATPTPVAKPTATATIEPMGRRTKIPRDHLIKVLLTLSAIDAKHTDKGQVARVARQSFESLSPSTDQPDRRKFV